MKLTAKTRILFMFVILILSAFSCRLKPLSAEEILSQSREKMGEIKTMSMGMEITMKTEGLSLVLNAKGVVEAPSKSYLTMEIMGQEVEVLVLGKTEAYMRQSGSTVWEPISMEQLAQAGVSSMSATDQLKILDYALNLQKVENEKIDGVDCFHLTMDVDAIKMLQLTNPTLAQQVGAGDTPAKVDLWIGSGDFLVRKMVMQMNIKTNGMDVDTNTVLTFSNFNEPVEIPQP